MVASKSNPVLVWMNFIKEGVNNGDPTVLGILMAVAVVFLTIGKEINNDFGSVSSKSCNFLAAIW